MTDITISSLETIKRIPAIKAIYENEFVRVRIARFEQFLGRVLRQNVKKVAIPVKKKLTVLNWVLINGVVFAYFIGKAEAQNVDYLEYLYLNYSIVGVWSIATNAVAFILLGIGKILHIAVKIVSYVLAFLLATFVIYCVIKKVWEFFTKGGCCQKELLDQCDSCCVTELNPPRSTAHP